jgi:hypothetical protein
MHTRRKKHRYHPLQVVNRARLRTGVVAALAIACVGLPLSASGGAFRAYPGQVAFVRSGEVCVSSAANISCSNAPNPLAAGSDPAVSPDGKTVAFDSGSQISTVPITGGTATTIAAGTQPAWSLNGTTIWFITPTGGIATVPSGGGSPSDYTNVPSTTGNRDVTVSPDGTTIAFANNTTGSYQIYTATTNGSGTFARFTNDSSNDTHPSFSPTFTQGGGGSLVYSSDRSGKNQIFTANFPNGSGETQLTSDSNADSAPAFSPDGKLVLFSSDASGLQNVRFFTPHSVAPLSGTQAGDALPDWQDAPPVNTSAPVVSGTNQPGSTLTASTGTWDGFPNAIFKYQWQRCPSGVACGPTDPNWVNIASATNASYVVQSGDAGFSIRVEVVATNIAGDAPPAPSLPAGSNTGPPVNLTRPVVTGNPTANPGGFLSGTAGTWAGVTPITYTYQWLRCFGLTDGHCVPIPGATSSFYTPTGDDIATQLNVGVVATNSAGSAFANSDATPYITGDPPHNHVSPSLSGGIHVGETLSTTDGVWLGPTPLTFTYQWRSCDPFGNDCNSIPGATGKSYTLQPGDYGSTIRMMIRARNGAGFAYGISNHTLPILHKTLYGPSTTSPPTVAGPARVDAILVADQGTWSGEVPMKFSYGWERCDATGGTCTTIAKQSAKTYRIVSKDIGSTIRFKVTAVNIVNTGIAFSSTTDAVVGTRKKPKGRKLVGTNGPDYLAGGGGDDRIYGMGGADTILGGAGDDYLSGGDGNDVITGGPGSDTILGGAGSDTIYAADGERDYIDCGPGNDRAYVDALDVVKNCEVVTLVSTPSTPTPTPTPPPTPKPPPAPQSPQQ